MRYDPGLQPERTELSWNRTSLSMIVGGVAGLKLLPAFLGVAGIALGIAAVGAGVGLGWASHRRAARSLRVLLAGRGPLPDGRLLLGIAACVSLLAAVAAVALFLLPEVR